MAAALSGTTATLTWTAPIGSPIANPTTETTASRQGKSISSKPAVRVASRSDDRWTLHTAGAPFESGLLS